MLELDCAVQTYAWGKTGRSSLVGRLSPDTVDDATPYAELWMGTHPNAPSVDKHSRQPLQKPLPYLFKVLSIAKALSIQAHPDKALAERLHAERPEIYKDDNHKPEMVCALTRFEALCGFRPKDEILGYLHSVPEFAELVGLDLITQFSHSDCLKEVFTKIMTTSSKTVCKSVERLVQRLSDQKLCDTESKLVIRLNRDFPGDIGVFAVYLLNYFMLEPGQALFLGANLPHAYLSGDCVESMACSDNVVRAGLTPKLIDTDTLCEMLEYKCERPGFVQDTPIDDYTSLYSPPIDEFQMTRSIIPSDFSITVPSVPSDSIGVVTQGTGTAALQEDSKINVLPGSVLYIPAGDAVVIASACEPLHFYRCFNR